MLLGGDQFNKSLDHTLIIKCYKCGTPNLRYIGGAANPQGDFEKPYLCENGHWTWGAVDDWSIRGQTDTALQAVNDNICEANACDFPKRISVEFSGIKGVQAREGSYYQNFSKWDGESEDQLWMDFASRISMPYSMCCECSTWSQRYNNDTGVGGVGDIKDLWNFYSCGGMYADSSGNIIIDGHPNATNRSMWPWRIATFRSSGYETSYQLVLDENGEWYGSDHVAPGRCGCLDRAIPRVANPPCSNPSGVPVDLCPQVIYYAPNGERMAVLAPIIDVATCMTPHYYPTCMEHGTKKCAGRDDKYRVPCENPNNAYEIDLGSQSGSYTANLTPLSRLVGNGGPFFDFRNCCDFGFISMSGVAPVAGCEWFGAPESISMSNRFRNPQSKVEQPHCVRRVESPSYSMHQQYAVNTEDLSNQKIILDRYYRTGGAYDFEWKNELDPTKQGPPSGNNILNVGDRGISDFLAGRLYPHPYTSHSGSIEEPEIVAIIHSAKGKGGQIAFDTFPVTWESEILQDPLIGFFKPAKGACNWKHRVTVHGYGVKYPLIDDPQWHNTFKNYMTYPVFTPGVGYEIGDKIEFRCWKCLPDAAERGAVPLEDEQIWKEECIESIIATATVTELDDERLAPSRYIELTYSGIKDSEDPVDDTRKLLDLTPFITPVYADASNRRYYETYKIAGVVLDYKGLKTAYKSADHVADDVFTVGFKSNPDSIADCDNGVCVDTAPTIIVDSVDDAGVPKTLSVLDPGEFYKIIRTGGIRWYDFDEVDQNGDYLISVGNCPCDWDLCGVPDTTDSLDLPLDPNEIAANAARVCVGCLSRYVYPSGHEKLDALPEQKNPITGGMTPGGFPAMAAPACVGGLRTREGYEYYDYEYCESTNQLSCDNEFCLYTNFLKILWEEQPGGGSRFYVDVDESPNTTYTTTQCSDKNNCACRYPDLPSRDPVFDIDGYYCSAFAEGETWTGGCYCSTASPWAGGNVAPFYLAESGSGKCFPLNRTWEWFPQNYALSACSGEPVIPGYRPYVSGLVVIPPRRPQVKYQWLPKPQTTYDQIEPIASIFYDGIDPYGIKAIREDFMGNSGPGCNPLNLDIEFGSWKFPNPTANISYNLDECCGNYQSTNPAFDCFVATEEERQSLEELCDLNAGGTTVSFDVDFPCKKWNDFNPLTPKNSGGLDDYCRVYGFYQQVQPTCDIVYKGQYIMRASEKDYDLGNAAFSSLKDLRGTDCNPVIENLTIELHKKRAQFDISLGAPLDQDYLIPENLPTPINGLVAADAWAYPSRENSFKTGNHDYGVHEIKRKLFRTQKIIPDESIDNFDPYYVDEIIPSTALYSIDGGDFLPGESGNIGTDLLYQDVWDLQDPRTNIRAGLKGYDLGDTCEQPKYSGVAFSGALSAWPKETLRNTFVQEFPLPWENYCQSIGNPCKDFFAMYKNSSAEIVLGDIKHCEFCTSHEVMITNPANWIFQNISPTYPTLFHYTTSLFVSEQSGQGSDPEAEYVERSWLFFRGYADEFADSSDVNIATNHIQSVVADYVNVFSDRLPDAGTSGVGEAFLYTLTGDVNRRIFSNMIFQGSSTDLIPALNKLEIFRYQALYDTRFTNPIQIRDFALIWEDSRCHQPLLAGSIGSLYVQNGGGGYAFEIEERVNPTGIVPFFGYGSGTITGTFISLPGIYRRREKYALSGVVIDHRGSGDYKVGDLITIDFSDTDYRRAGIYYETFPQIELTDVQDGTIIDARVAESGVFWKYVGTGQHRAFPISTVINNYWDDPSDNTRVGSGKNAIFSPIVSVEPSSVYYGKVVGTNLEYGGQDYMAPRSYWTIDTKAGTYDQWGDLTAGLDIRHLSDPCRFRIDGDGMSPSGVARYRSWLAEVNGFSYAGMAAAEPAVFSDNPYPTESWWTNNFNEIQLPPPYTSSWKDISNGIPAFDKPSSYYYHTPSDIYGRALKWVDKVKPWLSVVDLSSCPFEKGGLLDRTYEMALVEQVTLATQSASIGQFGYRPYQANCSNDLCALLTSYSGQCDLILLPGRDDPPPDTGNPDEGEPAMAIGFPSGDEILYGADPKYSMRYDEISATAAWGRDYSNCHWLECNNYTAYDAHRYGIVYSDNVVLGWNSLGAPEAMRPKQQGCPQRVSPYDVYCANPYNTSYRDISASLAGDECSAAQYSLYAEFTQQRGGGGSVERFMRSKMITYEMDGPITMKVNFFDPKHEQKVNNRVCPSGHWCGCSGEV